MSTDWESVAGDAHASHASENADVAVRAPLEAFGAERWDGVDADPPMERIVVDTDAGGDDEVGVTVEGRLEDASVDSVVALVAEDYCADRIVVDDPSSSEDAASVSFEGGFDERTGLLGEVAGSDADFDHLAFDPERGDGDDIGFSLHGRFDDAGVGGDGDSVPDSRIVIEPEGE
ncbi:hypothetical protein NDI76_09900 [Halogeometricum sp. S1BR25-6]|uniref:Uncharacterized protein n=1 Tax=Halogeometricum salsisoli TaxID=2950536 RepID=A0ABU2GE23_9EURY|nr:hypothetical protein [Halogeometricum sp. S1BR25-6]MDS0299057.1 hypothetical protein [Halogeometricum sp. S1BR25-6]